MMTRAMTRVPVAGVAAILVAAVLSAGPARADDPAGQQAFLANKCNLCHSVDKLEIARTSTSDKMKGPDLSTTGDDLDLEWAVKFLKKEVELEGSLHKKEFKGTDEELQQIVQWLGTLRSESG